MAEAYLRSTWTGAGRHHRSPRIRLALLLAICLPACVSLPVTAAARPAAARPAAARLATATRTGAAGSVGCGQGSDEAVSPALQTAMSDSRTRALLDLVNAERKNACLSPLGLDERLCIVARRHAEDMIRSQYFGHLSPNSGTLAGRLAAAGAIFEKAGENLAGNTSVADAHKMLMRSPVHRGNILNPGFTMIGAAVVKGGPYGMMIVEVFVDKRTTLATATPDNSSESLMPQQSPPRASQANRR